MYSKCLQLDHFRTLVIIFTTMKGSSLPNIHLIDSKCLQLDNFRTLVTIFTTMIGSSLQKFLLIYSECWQLDHFRASVVFFTTVKGSSLPEILLLDFKPLKTLLFSKLKSLRPYSKPFIFFLTYKWPNKLESYITLD